MSVPSVRAALLLLSAALALPPVAAGATIVDLQTTRKEEILRSKTGTVRLVNLNPAVNAWYLLDLQKGKKHLVYNLENAHPGQQRLHLSESTPGGVVIADYLGTKACDLWTDGATALSAAAASHKPFAPICDARLLLRNHASGHRSVKEMAVDFLRDNVWGGESITTFFKETLFKDKYLLPSKASDDVAVEGQTASDGYGPEGAQVAPGSQAMEPQQLGIRLGAEAASALTAGRWYPAKNQPGVFVSEIAARRVAPALLQSYPGSVSRLDPVEAGATAYLVAFDLARFNVGFTLGTDHPRVDWSPRAASCKEPGLPGPDGFSTVAPLVVSGILNPTFRPGVVATFAGGFKRNHGAFKWGELAKKNHGSHYGFIEDGVVFSKLQPGLATLFVKSNGSFGMKTWTEADNEMLPELRYARQNGVPIIERRGAGPGAPSAYVSDWARGNWSGSAESKFRSLRSGLCLMREGQQRYLTYGYFSSATPNSMARVFQAYGCEYAMHLDMNAPEHTYMALYHDTKKGLGVEHLVKVMSAYDAKDGSRTVPRFVGMPDNRDFVFLYKKPADF